jgi:hypothetical protein
MVMPIFECPSFSLTTLGCPPLCLFPFRWGLTEFCRKSSDGVERASAEEMATEVENGAGAKVAPA